MGQIQIKYEEVYAKTAELKGTINDDLLIRINNEYSQIQSMLDSVDSTTNAALKDTIEQNRQKSIIVVETLYKLLSFMSNSAKQMELNEQKMANSIASGKSQNTTGEDK